VGSAELTPRILLTSAPYALSLIGTTNKFPSSGVVVADSIRVNGGVLARGGAPGLNGVNKNGYAFTGNGGDKDSGVFSTADGKVSLYANNIEILAVTPTAAQVNTNLTVGGNLTANNLSLPTGSTITYNGLNDWRLVDVDNFDAGADGWQVYSPASGQESGWNNGSSAGGAPTTDFGGFAGDVLYPGENRQVLKKNFNIPGSFTQIKVKFKYYFIDTWGFGFNDEAYAGFAQDASGSGLRIAWNHAGIYMSDNDVLDGGPFDSATNFAGDTQSDHWIDVEMRARAVGNSFWVFIGCAVDESTANERYAVGNLEIWVK
jgi:hypothetical protein